MNSILENVLQHVALTGGCNADSRYLRDTLGPAALGLKNELRLIDLGCADASLIERVRTAAGQAAA